MNAVKLNAIIPSDRRLVVNLPDSMPPGAAEVVVVSHAPSQAGTGQTILEFLRDNPLPEQCRRSPEAIEADIQAEREAWD